MMNLTLAIAVLVAASALAWKLISQGHYISPVILFLFSVWASCSIVAPNGSPLFQSSISITKDTVSEAEKETP